MQTITKMDSLSGICYNVGEYDCCGKDQHPETKIMNGTRSSSSSCHGSSRRTKSRWDQSESSLRSLGSLLTTMEKFVQTVDDMNETILVPCRLMDAKFDSSSTAQQAQQSLVSLQQSGPGTTLATTFQDPKARLMTNLNGVDLFQFYTILNSVKSDLMWGNKGSGSNGGQIQAPHPHGSSGISSFVHSGSTTSSSSGNSSSASSVTSASIPPATTTTNNNNHGEVMAKGHVRRPSTVSTASSASASDTGNESQEFSDLNEDSGLEGEEDYSQHLAESFHHHLTGLQQCLRDLTLAADYVTNRYNTDLGGV